MKIIGVILKIIKWPLNLLKKFVCFMMLISKSIVSSFKSVFTFLYYLYIVIFCLLAIIFSSTLNGCNLTIVNKNFPQDTSTILFSCSIALIVGSFTFIVLSITKYGDNIPLYRDLRNAHKATICYPKLIASLFFQVLAFTLSYLCKQNLCIVIQFVLFLLMQIIVYVIEIKLLCFNDKEIQKIIISEVNKENE